MKNLRNQCVISDVALTQNLSIEFTIELTGEVLRLRNEQNKLPVAHVQYYGDDAHKGDELLYTSHDYPVKVSQAPIIKDRTHIPNRLPKELANEDKTGPDEIYALFYLTMQLEVDGVEVDALISEVVKSDTIIIKWPK